MKQVTQHDVNVEIAKVLAEVTLTFKVVREALAAIDARLTILEEKSGR